MNSLFLENGEMTALEFECECMQKEFDVAMSEINFMLEMVDMNEKINHEKAELKVMKEGGNVDDLAMLYNEASDEATGTKKGIIGTLIDKIIGFFKKIGDAFASLFTGKSKEVPDNKPVEVSTRDMTKLEKAGAILNEYKGIIALAIGTATGAILLTKWKPAKEKIDGIRSGVNAKIEENATKNAEAKEVKKKAKKCEEIAKDAGHALNQLKSMAESQGSEEAAKDPEKTKVISDILNHMSKWASELMELPGKLGKALTNVVGNAIGKLKGDQGEDPFDDDEEYLPNRKAAKKAELDARMANRKAKETKENADPTFESGSIDEIMDLINSL